MLTQSYVKIAGQFVCLSPTLKVMFHEEYWSLEPVLSIIIKQQSVIYYMVCSSSDYRPYVILRK